MSEKGKIKRNVKAINLGEALLKRIITALNVTFID